MFQKRKDPRGRIGEPEETYTNYSHTTNAHIHTTINKMERSGGTTNLPAKALKRWVNNQAYGQEGTRIIDAIRIYIAKITTKALNHEYTVPFRAVRFVALEKTDKKIRPIGISEILRRVVTKIVASSMKEDSKAVTGSTQVQGLTAACEASNKAMNEMYLPGNTILVLDAEAAFNNLSRTNALRTVAQKLPQAYNVLNNLYQHPTRGFYGNKEITVEEGIIQGCPLSTTFYDLGISALSDELKSDNIRHIWQCDDLAAAGKPAELKAWLQKVRTNGPGYGYKLNKGKSHVLSRNPEDLKTFKNELEAGILTIAEGTRYLG